MQEDEEVVRNDGSFLLSSKVVFGYCIDSLYFSLFLHLADCFCDLAALI